MTTNQGVGGSNPPRSATSSHKIFIYQHLVSVDLFLSPILSPKNNLMLPLAPARDTVLYCVLTCLARACATCVSLLNWGSTRALARDRCHLVRLNHQPASAEHSSKVKLGWYSSHHFRRSFVSSSGPSSVNTVKRITNTKKHAMKTMK